VSPYSLCKNDQSLSQTIRPLASSSISTDRKDSNEGRGFHDLYMGGGVLALILHIVKSESGSCMLSRRRVSPDRLQHWDDF